MNQAFASCELRVVEASAGSGKTYALARRYVQLLLVNARSGDLSLQPAFRSILALTFTNKAAFEMKARILEFLKRIAFKDFSSQEVIEILSPLKISPDEASLLARGVMESLIRHYNYFQVQTIDKFINALLVGCAFKVGLTANFCIKTNPRAYIEYALDEVIDSASQTPAVRRLFEDFIDHYLYLENRSQWLPKDGILEILTNLFSVNDTYALPLAMQSMPTEEVIKQKKVILSLVKSLYDKVPHEDLHATFVKSMTGFLERHKEGFDFDILSDFFQREDIPAKKDAALSGEAYALWDKIRRSIRELAQMEVFCLYNPYLVIFDNVREKYEAACRKEDVLFLSELNRKARAIFEEGLTPQELYYRLASRFRHYLLDEFQDTSRLQWQNLSMLPGEALSTGGSLFYVGDKKQAIYGFRGGEAGLFDTAKTSFPVENVQTETLSTNWRSHKAIVEFNNTVFAMENLKSFVREKDEDDDGKIKKDAIGFSKDDVTALESIYGNAKQSYRPEHAMGYVRMEYVDAQGREEKFDMVKARFLGLMKDFKERGVLWRDVAVLTRSNSELLEITRWLLEAGVPVTSERTTDIKEHSLIREVVAFLTFIHSPLDNAAFAEFILGQIFVSFSGLSLETLREFVLNERRKSTKIREPYLYMAFRTSFPTVWENCIEEFFKTSGLYPLYELVVSFYGKAKLLSQFPEAQGFFMHLLELIKNREEEYCDLGAFLADYEGMEGEELYVRLTGRNAVRLLTFHKSKGLEFPIVILPFLTMKVDVGSGGGGDKKQAYVLREANGELQFLRLKKDYGKYSEEALLIYEDEYKKNFLSELNMIYVSLTRASREMYGFLPSKAGSSRNLARKLITAGVWGQVPDSLPVANITAPAALALKAGADRDWITFLKDEFMADNELSLRRAREEGGRPLYQ
ncbi:MAG: UvrD-helicase domain-containing protein [Candidatus Omnitrophica bacterium]|nr:UvrD-helicase domain-containing protein [Candidatus Omnitrophota bacterium]